MIDKHLPYVSAIIVTYNRSDQVLPCLESLEKQTYPKSSYEIIVVDDGSTDDTAQIAHLAGVQVIRHETNRGISAARNSGLAAAKGEITVYIDDDAVADPGWLEYLVQPFNAPGVTASGGRTFAYKTETITERYLSTTGYGNPAPLGFGKSKNPLWRFLIYIKSMFVPIDLATEPIEVQAVFGLNCAFRTLVLRAAGGFDETLRADEDSEISTRLRNNGARIIFVPQAVIRHRHRESLRYLILQTYRRAEATLHYYAKEKKALPIFPLPPIYLTLVICLLLIQPLIALIFIVFGPLILYIWWPIRALRKHKVEYIVYGYIQFMLESAAILGILGAKLRQTKKI